MKVAICKYCGVEFSYDRPRGGVTLHCDKCRTDYKKIKQRKSGVSTDRYQKMRDWRQQYNEEFKAYWKTHDPYAETLTKQCNSCQNTLSSKQFSRSAIAKDGLHGKCASCLHDSYCKRISRVLWEFARGRAKRAGIPFSIEVSDVVIPETCPVLGIPVKISKGEISPGSPTIDRWDNTGGYTPDNIRIISYRANSLKSDATAEEMRLVLEYMENGKFSQKSSQTHFIPRILKMRC